MLTIDRLKLQLPHGFEARSESILRQVAEGLSRLDIAADVRLPDIQLAPIKLDAGWQEPVLVQRIVRAIEQSVRSSIAANHRQQGGGGKL